MSAFVKPTTPTKNRASLKTSTPTKSKSLSNVGSGSGGGISNISSSAKVLDDINVLLYLETLKRNRDSEAILRQRVEEAYKLFEERRNKYLSLVAKYAALVKLACTRKVLLRNDLVEFPTSTAQDSAKSVREKLSSGSATDYINNTELSKFKEILHMMEKFKNLPIKRSELVELQNAIEAIQCSIEAIEISLEKCTVQGLDHFADTLNMENFPKLQNEYKYNQY